MKKIIDKWFGKNKCKNFTITNYKKPWQKNGIKPFFSIRTNGARRWRVNRNNTCLSITLTLWYIDICYTNFELQNPNLLDRLFALTTPYVLSWIINSMIYIPLSLLTTFILSDKIWILNISFLTGMVTMLLNILYIFPKSEEMIKNAKTRLYKVSNDGNTTRD